MAKHQQRRLPRTAPEDEALERELEGRKPDDYQGEGVIPASRVDDLGEISPTDIYEGELEAGVNDDLPDDPESLELLTELELRGDETSDAFEATEGGETYIPPIDPPTVPSNDRQGVRIAAGFAVSARDDSYDEDSPADALPADDDFSQRVRDALRADSATTAYAESVRVLTRGATVILRGLVDDLEDSDNLVAVASDVDGVAEVIDELEVRSMR